MENQKQTSSKFLAIIVICLILAAGAFALYKAGYLKGTAQNPSQVTQTQTEPDKKVPATIGATLAFIEGAVEYKKSDGDWTRADGNVSLYQGYSVEVIGNGKAIINLDDGSAVRLNSDTAITLTKMDPNNIEITNDKGEIYSRVTKSDRIFIVKAETIAYQSMGTAYKITCTDKENGVDVYQSKVKVKKDKEEITVDEGKKYYIENKENPKEEKVIKEITKEEWQKDEFINWNKTQDEANSEYKTAMGILSSEDTEKDTAADQNTDTSTSAGIQLSAKAVDSGIKFTWSVSGVDVNQGFKLVKSTEINPVYPGNDYQYLSDEATHSYTWALKDGKTYYFRVCQYLGGKCGVYSNNVKMTAPQKETTDNAVSGEVSSITLSSLGSGNVKWSVDGYSDQGFKVVWSKNSQPTYPCRSGDQYLYYSNPQTTSATVTAFNGTGTYYVRVCEYLGGKCGTYSNQITVNLTSDKEEAKDTGVNSITLSGSGSSFSWSVDGYSDSGFKLVWSKTSHPTYPCRDTDKYNYYSDPNTKSGSIDAFDGEGTYYVRVCEYLGGKCGIYSNQLQVEL